MRYVLIESDNIETFVKSIYNKLNSGWKPHGNIFSFNKDNKIINTLAMIKDEQITAKTPVIDNKTVEEILASWNC